MSPSWEEARGSVFSRLTDNEKAVAALAAEIHAIRSEQSRCQSEIKEDFVEVKTTLGKLFTALDGEPGRMGLRDRLFRVEIVVVPALLGFFMFIGGVAGVAVTKWLGL